MSLIPVVIDREELPLLGHALQCVPAAVSEGDAGSEHQRSDRVRDQHLAGRREGRDPSADVHRQADDGWTFLRDLAYGGVIPGATARSEAGVALQPMCATDGSTLEAYPPAKFVAVIVPVPTGPLDPISWHVTVAPELTSR